MMSKIQTSRFGELEFPEETKIHFAEGVLGFPDNHDYIILEHDAENGPFKWLQAVDSPDLAFIVMDPLLLVDHYPLLLDADTAKMIQVSDASSCALMAIVNVPADRPINMSANLKAPLIVNPELRLGRQIILGSQAFSINEPIFPRLNERMESHAQSAHAQTA